jgi:hypothetical protein
MHHPDDPEDHLATPAESVAEWAYNAGEEMPDRAWLLHDWDVWVANPHYSGPPVPHPEDYGPEGEEAPGFDSPKPPEWTGFDSQELDSDFDEIPF